MIKYFNLNIHILKYFMNIFSIFIILQNKVWNTPFYFYNNNSNNKQKREVISEINEKKQANYQRWQNVHM